MHECFNFCIVHPQPLPVRCDRLHILNRLDIGLLQLRQFLGGQFRNIADKIKRLACFNEQLELANPAIDLSMP